MAGMMRVGRKGKGNWIWDRDWKSRWKAYYWKACYWKRSHRYLTPIILANKDHLLLMYFMLS